jgi:hypothetical protein
MQEKCKCGDNRPALSNGYCEQCQTCYKAVQEKSVVENWEREWDSKWTRGYTDEEGIFHEDMMSNMQKDFIHNLQKETDDKWKEKIGEAIKRIDGLEDYWSDARECRVLEKDQATSIIKEVIDI